MVRVTCRVCGETDFRYNAQGRATTMCRACQGREDTVAARLAPSPTAAELRAQAAEAKKAQEELRRFARENREGERAELLAKMEAARAARAALRRQARRQRERAERASRREERKQAVRESLERGRHLRARVPATVPETQMLEYSPARRDAARPRQRARKPLPSDIRWTPLADGGAALPAEAAG